jgi:hypothetical protein
MVASASAYNVCAVMNKNIARVAAIYLNPRRAVLTNASAARSGSQKQKDDI